MTKDEIQKSLVQEIAHVLGIEPDSVDPRERFNRSGLDSLGTTRMIAALSQLLGRPLSPTLAWEYPTVEALASFLAQSADHHPTAIIDTTKSARNRVDEPIAIVGMACRFPGGAENPGLFWRLLCEGFDAITDVPKNRWNFDESENAEPPDSRRTYLRRGGFLHEIDGFDPLHFHISPREAEQMDPQQRLMLELSWEAIEDAGVVVEKLRGSSTGVFTGVVFGDYDVIQDVTGDRKTNQYTTTGSVQAVIANRISYVLGLSGPSYVVNAACASSLLAVHLACQSIRNGECAVALAGGVQLNMAMTTSLGVSRFGALSPDGLCRTFDADANGYVRGEGAGVIVLRPLSEARRRGDRIYAIIRGSATNNNGAGNGLTAPSPEAQRAVIADALDRAQVDPATIQYVELHGTGTILGDPIEASALGSAYTRSRPPGPNLLVGSVKTNIGHLEASAGIAGLMKTALALYHQRLPPSLHFKRGNPYIDFESLKLEVVTAVRTWPDIGNGVYRAGVSSFGFGGTNVHAIVESWPAPVGHILPLAAASGPELENLASRMRDWLEHGPASISAADICCAAGNRLTSGPVRLAVVGASRDALAHALGQWRDGTTTGTSLPGSSRKTVFVFSGLGSQWAVMSRRVWDANPAFMAALHQCDAYFEPISGWSIVRILFDDDVPDLLNGMDRLDVIVPLLVAVQIAMARLWMAWGIEPGALVGHSVGEIAAAHIAGVIDLHEAMTIAYHTALAYRASVVSGTGMLAFLGCTPNELVSLLEAAQADVFVAGQNDPHSCIVSGVANAVRQLVEECTQRGIFARILGNVYAHCPSVRPFTTDLSRALAGRLARRKPRIPMMSTVTGSWILNSDIDVAHWVANIEQPVRFGAGIESLWREGFGCFVEMSPHAILTRSINTTITAMGGEPLVIASELRGDGEPGPLPKALGRLFEVGADVNWSSVLPAVGSQLALPPDLIFDRKVEFENSPARLFTLSAGTESALNAYICRLGDHLRAHPELAPGDVAHSLAMTRSTMAHRAAIVSTSREDLLELLDADATGRTAAGIARGFAATRTPQVIFVFPGQGSQWVGMARRLRREEPFFGDALSAGDEAIRKEAGFSILEELDKPEETSRLGETIVAQPVLFAIEVALAKLFQFWGVVPSAVIGHSVGEIAAAHIAGMLDLEQAARLVSVRARIMQKATGRGKMVSVSLDEHAAKQIISEMKDRVGIAAINDGTSVVLSGDIDVVNDIVERLTARGVRSRPLRVNYAFHSPQMDEFLDEFIAALGELNAKPGSISMISTVTGQTISSGDLDARYWSRNIRQTVRFADAITSALNHDHPLVIEVGPHPVLSISIEQTLEAHHVDGRAIPTLRRDQDEHKNVLRALGTLFLHGAEFDGKKLHPRGGRLVELPPYAWQRERYWIVPPTSTAHDARSAGQDTLDHPFLHAAISLPEDTGLLLTGRLSLREHSWLSDHRVAGQNVFPGTGWLEMALVVANRAGLSLVEELTLETPLFLSSATATALRVMLEPPDDTGRRRIVMHARAEGEADDAPWTRHAQGIVAQLGPEMRESVPTPPAVNTPIEVDKLYSRLAEQGLEYGAAFRGLTSLWRDADSIYAEVSLPASFGAERGAFKIHPALFDAAIQSVADSLELSDGQVWMPFQFGGVSLYGIVGANARVQARVDSRLGPEAFSASIVLTDAAGNIVAALSNILLKRTPIEGVRRSRIRQSISEHLYCLDWLESTSSGQMLPIGGTWLLLGENTELSRDVTIRLSAMGGRVENRPIDAWLESPEPFDPPLRVVWFCHANVAEDVSCPQRAQWTSSRALRLSQTLSKLGKPAQITFVTRSAVSVEVGESVWPEYAAIWGYGRTLMNEHPEFECKLVDFNASENIHESLWRELFYVGEENQIAWREGKRFVARLAKMPLPAKTSLPDDVNYCLTVGEKGVFSNLRFDALERRAPGAGEVEIEVSASGLNFRDVLNTLGMYPGEAGLLGAECSGYVVAVGDRVHHVQVGDRVMALVPGAFRAFVTVDARLVAPVPKALSMVEAATIPVVFLTAHYALHDLANLQAGEHILVHAAAGGVGMAAVQIATQIGAKILATASPSKWSVVRAMGVEHVASSRNIEFAEAFRDVSAGRGVDVVLNALTGEFVDAGLSLLRAGGRFLEMGKTDIQPSETIAHNHPGVTYRAFDLWEAGPERIREMLAAIVAGFESGALHPLPVRCFPIQEAQAAFRFMAQARHIGKIALFAAPAQTGFSRGTVLVTGGLGALGLRVARWLWERYRIANLVLVGRSGPTEETSAEIERLRSEGAVVTIARVDVSDAPAVRAFMNSIPQDRPLRGIIHAAGVLDDGIIAEQTPDRFVRVFGPKVQGAWNLYEATRHEPLAFFVFFSSVAGIFGNAGQSSYAAANAFLDGLAAQIRAAGIFASSLAWGPWDGGGMAAKLRDQDLVRLKRAGLLPMRVGEGLAIVEESLRLPNALLIPMNLDVAALARNDSIPPLVRGLVSSRVQVSTTVHTPPSSTMPLARVPEAQRFTHAMAAVRRVAAEVLGLSGQDAVPTDKSLFELGLDSLMTVELRNRIAKLLGVQLDANVIMQAPRPIELVAEILRALDVSTAKKQTITIPPIPSGAHQAITIPPMPSSTRQVITIPPMPSSSRRSTLHPLSSAQSRLYFLDRILERRETYNVQIALQVKAVLNVDRLKFALAKLAIRHDQLRMQIFEGPDGPQQRILPWVDISLEEIDLRADARDEFIRIVHERGAVPFDLAKAPLLRVTLAHLDDQSSGLILVWHHIATDGWSIGRFLQDLEAYYTASDIQLPPIPAYHELVVARRLEGIARDDHQLWWTNYLAGAEPLELPTDHNPARR